MMPNRIPRTLVFAVMLPVILAGTLDRTLASGPAKPAKEDGEVMRLYVPDLLVGIQSQEEVVDIEPVTISEAPAASVADLNAAIAQPAAEPADDVRLKPQTAQGSIALLLRSLPTSMQVGLERTYSGPVTLPPAHTSRLGRTRLLFRTS